MDAASRCAPTPAADTPAWAVGYVYLVESSMDWQKLGFSTNPGRRERQYTHLPFETWMSHEFPVGARSVETRLHGFFITRRVRGEWYALGADGVSLVKTVAEARSVVSLPPPFSAPRYLAPWSPAVPAASWGLIAGGFAFRLQCLRAERGLTHEQLAERSGVPPWHIRTLERQEAPTISWHEALQLARGLGVPTDAFRDEAK